MTRKEAVDILNQFEAKHPVEKWVVDGVHVWPVIKINLFFLFLKKIDIRYREKDDSSEAHNKNNLIMKAYRLLNSSFLLFCLIFSKNIKKPTVLCVENNANRSIYQGDYINRLFFPIAKYLRNKYPEFLIKYFNGSQGEGTYPKDEAIMFTGKYFHIIGLIHLFRKSEVTLPQYEKFNKEFGKMGLNIIDDDQFFKNTLSMVKNINQIKYLTKLIIRKKNVKMIFELCYYSQPSYGVNVAAKELGVKTVEIQHGGMGPEHIAYSGWSKFPIAGYEVMPSTIWLWSEVDCELVDMWIKKQNYHAYILGGNPWITYLIEDYKQNIDKILEGNKKKILYTLQSHSIDKYILETISQTCHDFQWFIRLHPRKLNAKKTILQQLTDFGVETMVEIDISTNMPLPILLSKIDLHISAFSGSISEAAMLNKLTIIIDEIGVSSYQKYIDTGMAIAELNKSSKCLALKINKAIELSFKRNKESEIDAKAQFELCMNTLMEINESHVVAQNKE